MEVTKVENQRLAIQKKIDKVLCSKAEPETCCPVKDILARFGDKWSIYTILTLGKEEKLRFNELKSQINGVSQRMLTVTLRSLEEDGLVSRQVYPEIPPRVEYSLTPLGQGLLLQLLQLADWAKLNIDQILEARERYAKKEKQAQLA
ncbi:MULTISPECIES: helix-turn-helix domain-containing protein [Pontibacter]|uniref:Transcriptional regulator, HxlR family n=1 Tax=Pontibacter lucknowensis TaxID=1077936 RepID=A0A1N6ZK36_9BACT|nr:MULTISPECIES: helix-turn-helix domain-containing protein [Pontibacter]EJF10438.1 HxlR family transcriptional regulator [Pontibacter sp. BAB1700]SIR27096.1 transcriptional regulator, HxlR family [Pontibacter lucknowensis]